MKKLLFALLAALILTLPAYAYTVPDDTVVYVTDHGEKYHREDCTYTSDSAHPMTIEKAEAKGYTPCSRCDPDRRTGEYVSNWDGESGSSGSSKSGSTSHASAGTSTNIAKKKSSGDIFSVLALVLLGAPYILWITISFGRIAVDSIRDFFRRRKR